MRGLGTLVNLVTVVGGGALGLVIGDRLAPRMRETIMQGLGLATVAVAITGFAPLYDSDAGLRRFVILIGSVILGGITGEALRLEDRLERLGVRIRDRFGVAEEEDAPRASDHSRFVDGFVIASTLFCVGPLTILGAIEDGVGASLRLLIIKSALDGFAALGLASVYGRGVLVSAAVILVYQGGLTVAASTIEPVMTPEVLAQLGAIGSLLVLGIALRLLEIKEVKVVNLLPAIFIGPLAAGVVTRL
ncbi:MAG TPA: DUF554 domain-containing protein [Actinomycetota bacterium]|nr:DUF554 domain-containing protein [Actinomycetota bacterium]